MFVFWKESYGKLRQGIKKQSLHFADKGLYSHSYSFPVIMYGCESWTIKKPEHWRIDAKELVLEKTLESPWVCKEIKSVNPKGNQPWIFIERTDDETPIIWPPDAKHWLIGEYSDSGKDWGPEEKRVIEDEMVGWYHWLMASMDMSLSQLWEIVKDRETWISTAHGVPKSWTQLSNWTTIGV